MRFFLAGMAALALAACASHSPEPSSTSHQPIYPATAERHAAVQIDANTILAPPPIADSALERAERDMVRGPWSEARRAQAAGDNVVDPYAAFSAVLGPNFTAANTPRTAALLDHVGEAAGFAGDPTKFVYRRLRPFVADSTITPCIPVDERVRASFSYPSGHGAFSWAWALTLAELVPAHADALLARGRDFGDSRVVCGLHYPSDIQAGRIVGASALARLHADAEFRADMDAARSELSAVLAR